MLLLLVRAASEGSHSSREASFKHPGAKVASRDTHSHTLQLNHSMIGRVDWHRVLHSPLPSVSARFKLSFSPALGLRPKRSSLSSSAHDRTRGWLRVPSVNNVFGRGKLMGDTACCQYLGKVDSLDSCIEAAKRHHTHVTSVTYHLLTADEKRSEWSGTCFGIIDGTWTPVKVSCATCSQGQPARCYSLMALLSCTRVVLRAQVTAGQAAADSARRLGWELPQHREYFLDGFVRESLENS